MGKKLLLIILFTLVFCSCSSNKSKKKEYFKKIGNSEDHYSYCIGKNESVFVFCYGNDDMMTLVYDELMREKNYSFDTPKITTKKYDDVLLFDCPQEWDSTLKITCLKQFKENIYIDCLYLEFSTFILEMPCRITLTYNENYSPESTIVKNVSSYGGMYDCLTNVGLIKSLKSSDEIIIGFAPFYKYGVEQNVTINKVESMDDDVAISSLSYAYGYVSNTTFDVQQLTYNELNLPFTVETTRDAYTYLKFNVPDSGDAFFYDYGFDTLIELTVNGDNYSNFFHVIVSY